MEVENVHVVGDWCPSYVFLGFSNLRLLQKLLWRPSDQVTRLFQRNITIFCGTSDFFELLLTVFTDASYLIQWQVQKTVFLLGVHWTWIADGGIGSVFVSSPISFGGGASATNDYWAFHVLFCACFNAFWKLTGNVYKTENERTITRVVMSLYMPVFLIGDMTQSSERNEQEISKERWRPWAYMRIGN